MAAVWIVVAALLIVGVRAVHVQQHRCHVCLSGTSSDVEIERVFPGVSVEACHHTTSVMACPENYRGCLTQSKGAHVMRTCAQLAVDACRWANSVEYCYCMGDQCNSPPPTLAPAPADDEDSDSADYTEGSGAQSVIPDTRETVNPTTTAVNVTTPLTSRAAAIQSHTLYVAIPVLVAVWR